MSRPAIVLLCALACLLAPAGAAADSSLTSAVRPASLAGSTRVDSAATKAAAAAHTTNPEAPIPVPASDVPPAGRRLSANAVLAIAGRLGKVRAERAKYRG